MRINLSDELLRHVVVYSKQNRRDINPTNSFKARGKVIHVRVFDRCLELILSNIYGIKIGTQKIPIVEHSPY